MYIHLFETIHLVGVQWKIAGKNREPQTQKVLLRPKQTRVALQKIHS